MTIMEFENDYGCVLTLPEECPKGFLMIVDAELNLIAYVPEEGAKVIMAALDSDEDPIPRKEEA